MNKHKEYTLGTLLTYASIAVSSVGGIFLTPIIIQYLGVSEYGLYQLLGSIIFYFGLFDFGLNTTTVRYLSLYKSQKNAQGEALYLGSVICLYSIIGIIILLVGYIGEFYFDTLFASSLTNTELEEGLIIYRLSYVTIGLTMPGRVFEGICRANERFVFIQMIAIIRYIIRATLILIFLLYIDKAITIVSIDIALTLLFYIVSWWYCKTTIRNTFDFNSLQLSYALKILSFSFWVFIACFVTAMQWSFSQIVLGSETNTEEVAILSVVIMLGSYYGVFASAINNVVVPKTMQIASSNASAQEMTDMLVATARASLPIMFLVLSGFFLFGRQFIDLWLGTAFESVWPMVILIMCLSTINLSYATANSILEAQRKIRLKTCISLVTTLAGGVSCMILVPHYGIRGVFFPTFAAVATNLILITLCYIYFFGFQVVRFFRKAWLKHLFVVTVYNSLAYPVIQFIDLENWINFVILLICHTVILSGLIFMFSCTQEERNRLYLFFK